MEKDRLIQWLLRQAFQKARYMSDAEFGAFADELVAGAALLKRRRDEWQEQQERNRALIEERRQRAEGEQP